jgi:hypothetical protein
MQAHENAYLNIWLAQVCRAARAAPQTRFLFDHDKVNELQHEQMEAKVLHSLTGSITILKAEHSTTSSPEFIHFALPNSSLLRYW